MPKLKKGIDIVDLKLLTALYYLGEGTAFDLSKITGVTRGTASKRLRDLVEERILEEPEVDISTGKLRKVYKAPNRKVIEGLLFKWWKVEVYEEVENITGEEWEEPPEKAFKEQLKSQIEWDFDIETLKQLRKGVSLKEILSSEEIDTVTLFEQEIIGNIEIKDGTVKLTEDGYMTLINRKKENIREEFEVLKEISKEEAIKFLEELKDKLT